MCLHSDVGHQRKKICYFCFIVTLVQKKHLFIKYLVCVSALHIQTCNMIRVVAQDSGVCAVLGNCRQRPGDRGVPTAVGGRRYRDAGVPGLAFESEVKSAHIPEGLVPTSSFQSPLTLISPYTISSMHRHCMLLEHHADSHIDMHQSICLGIYFIYLTRICSSSLDYKYGHFTVTAHFRSRRQMLKHKENSSLICITADNVFFECNQCLS